MAVWHRVETFRNRLPQVDHAWLPTLRPPTCPGAYCFSSLARFLVRVLQLSPGRRPPGSVPPQPSDHARRCWGKLQPLLPRLAGLQRAGAVSTEKVQIVAAMQKLSRTGDPMLSPPPNNYSATMHRCWNPSSCAATPAAWSTRLIRTAPNPSTTNGNKTAATWNSSNAATACGSCRADSATTVGAQLNALLDPLAKPRSSTMKMGRGHHPDSGSAALRQRFTTP